MALNVQKPDDPDHALVEHLIAYRQPKNEDVVRTLNDLREMFRITAHALVDRCPRSPDRTVALRKIQEACQASIAACVLNQEDT